MKLRGNAPGGRNRKSDGKTRTRARTWIMVTVAVCVLAVLIIGGMAGVTAYVNTIDRIFPRVTVDGLDISGMSLTETAAFLSGQGYDDMGENSVTVCLPMDCRLSLKASEVCTETPVAEIALMAYDSCKGGSALKNAFTYLKCLVSGMALESGSAITVDEGAVRAAVESTAREVKLLLMSSELTVGEDSILVVKGAGDVTIDTDQLVATIVEAFSSKNYGDIVYEPVISQTEKLDLDGLRETVYCEAADAYYDPETGEIVPEVLGMDFDTAEAARLWESADYGQEIRIPLILTEPGLSAEELNELLFRDMLSSMTTSLRGSSSNRRTNVAKACESINGTVLMPGDQFSYNEALGKRTAANGYLPAGAYANGETVQEYGGGICQVSSTLYYCCLYANLEISARTCHMFPVSYLPAGLDATVSWGGPEYKFVNDRDYPIEIRAWVEDDNVYVELWGTDVDGSYVQMTYSTWTVFDEEYTDVAIGYKAQTYRSVYDKDGNLLSRKAETLSFYHYHDEDIKWPEESPEPTETPVISETPRPSDDPGVTPDPWDTEDPGTTPDPGEQEPTEGSVIPGSGTLPTDTVEPTEPVG